jgi:hypothetical protein
MKRSYLTFKKKNEKKKKFEFVFILFREMRNEKRKKEGLTADYWLPVLGLVWQPIAILPLFLFTSSKNIKSKTF